MQPKLNFFVLAVALIALGVAAYALTQVAPTPHVPGAAPAAPPADGRDDIERRLAILEEARIREQWGSDPGIVERLNDLDRRLEAVSASLEAPTQADVVQDGSRVANGEVDPDSIERFRKLQAAAGRQARARRNQDRIRKVLAEHQITLTDEQQGQLVEAYGAFESRRNEIWGEAKRQGSQAGPEVDWEVIIADTNRVIQREFTERISGFIRGADAELLSTNLSTK